MSSRKRIESACKDNNLGIVSLIYDRGTQPTQMGIGRVNTIFNATAMCALALIQLIWFETETGFALLLGAFGWVGWAFEEAKTAKLRGSQAAAA